MDIESVCCVCFSPTGTTKAIAESIARGIGAGRTDMVDITRRSDRPERPLSFTQDLVIVAVPVYYGRVPEEIASYLSTCHAEQTGVVPVVVYGNRAFDDALKELHDIALGCGFRPVAGGAFVAEHSYSSTATPIAVDRPDSSDLEKALEFGTTIRGLLDGVQSLDELPPLAVPGEVPETEPENLTMIKAAREFVALTPETDASRCNECMACVEACPTGAISPGDITQTDRWQCILCFACVKGCPEGARQMNEPNFQAAIQGLHMACQERKEPEVFISG